MKKYFYLILAGLFLNIVSFYKNGWGEEDKGQTIKNTCESTTNSYAEMSDWQYQYYDQYHALTDATTTQLRLLKNEVFARRGYIFKSTDLKAYFSKQPWYRPNPQFNGSGLTEDEQDALSRVSMFESIVRLRPTEKQDANMVSKPVLIDIEGTGKKTKIWASYDPKQETETNLHINARTEKLAGEIYVVSINIKDRVKEIASSLMEEGGGSTVFYISKEGGLIEVGRIGGLIRSDIILYGDGKIKTKNARSTFLCSWVHSQIYKLDTNHKLIRIDQPSYEMNMHVTARERLNLQKSPQNAHVVKKILPGDRLTIVSSDNKRWVLAESTDCVKGWFEVDGHNTVHGPNKPSGDVFEGLTFAN